MARVEQLSLNVRRDIARQIGERLTAPPPGFAAESAPASLGFSLPISLLEPGNTQTPETDADWIIEATGRWHHQVVDFDGSVSFARSQPAPGGDGQDVQELVEAGSAAKVADAVAWVDSQPPEVIPEDADTRLLIAPALYLTAILLEAHGDRAFVVVERPNRLAGLEPHRIYRAEEFFDAIADIGPLGIPTSREGGE